ncbi:MAG: efflux RND transporter periplasmic adaptor subunit [Gammaproteobacteria bacterium]|nr:efflux RND transporter periplasmic adaptor subunit [Gammaproteobacteria bacterium]
MYKSVVGLIRYLACLATIGLLVSCSQPTPSINVEFRIPVEVAEINKGTVESLITATGILRTAEVANVSVEVPGYIYLARDENGNRLREGDTVTVGQQIAQVTGEDARLNARIESTRLALNTAKAELDRRQDLYDKGLIAETEVRQQEVSYEDALFSYDQSRNQAGKQNITSPIEGIILKLARDTQDLPIADGMLVAPGFELARIGPVEELIADVNLIGPELGKIKVGQSARIRHYAYRDKMHAGEVTHLAPTLDPINHTFKAEILVSNPDGLLLPGMYVETFVILDQRTDVIVVPRSSITSRSGNSIVFVLDGQRTRQQQVQLGLGDDYQVQVLEGVDVGDRVVVNGLETLTDGTRVRVLGS